tara:strand:- start:312 stop:1121 length:810 start_codon:yes stop_codon:yes gene_type:complete
MKITRRQIKALIRESWGDINDPNNPDANPDLVLKDMQGQGSVYDIQVQLAAQAATLEPPIYNHPDQFKSFAEELMKDMSDGRIQVDSFDDLLGRIDTGYLDEDIEDYVQKSGLRDGEELDDLPPWDSSADEWYESRRIWDQEELDEGFGIKLENRKQLRDLILETIDQLFPTSQALEVSRDQKEKSKLRQFYRLATKLNDIYNSHRSWDQSPNEQKIIDQIHIAREQLYSMGLRSDHLNAVKNMSYEDFDTLMDMDEEEFRLWKKSYLR